MALLVVLSDYKECFPLLYPGTSAHQGQTKRFQEYFAFYLFYNTWIAYCLMLFIFCILVVERVGAGEENRRTVVIGANLRLPCAESGAEGISIVCIILSYFNSVTNFSFLKTFCIFSPGVEMESCYPNDLSMTCTRDSLF